jgi:hypothetical protein
MKKNQHVIVFSDVDLFTNVPYNYVNEKFYIGLLAPLYWLDNPLGLFPRLRGMLTLRLNNRQGVLRMVEVTELATQNLKTYMEQNNIDSALRVALMSGG